MNTIKEQLYQLLEDAEIYRKQCASIHVKDNDETFQDLGETRMINNLLISGIKRIGLSIQPETINETNWLNLYDLNNGEKVELYSRNAVLDILRHFSAQFQSPEISEEALEKMAEDFKNQPY